jgi:hypothetical protein
MALILSIILKLAAIIPACDSYISSVVLENQLHASDCRPEPVSEFLEARGNCRRVRGGYKPVRASDRFKARGRADISDQLAHRRQPYLALLVPATIIMPRYSLPV